MIRWSDLDPYRVERAIKMLIRRLHPDAQGIDGSGGDNGRDIRWDSPDGLVIFEVKSYTARLTPTQRRDIATSLRTAAAHQPKRWVLILPLEPSPKEESWFDGLRDTHPAITLEWRGRDWLDGEFADREQFIRYVEGPDAALLQRAREFGMEQAALANGIPDLQGRVQMLQTRAQEIVAPPFQIGFAAFPDETTITIDVEPGSTVTPLLRLESVFRFPADDPEAAAAHQELTRAVEYGTGAVVDGQFIDRLDYDLHPDLAPLLGEDLTAPFHTERIQVVADPREIVAPFLLRAVEPNGTVAASTLITMTSSTGGLRGSELSGTDATKVLQIKIRIDHPDEAGRRTGEIELAVGDIVGLFPYALVPAADVLRAATSGVELQLCLGSQIIAHAEMAPDRLAEMRLVADLIEVLHDLQARFGQVFEIPDGITPDDLLHLQALRRFLTDGEAPWPFPSIVTAHITAEHLPEFLRRARLCEDQGPLMLPAVDWAVPCGPHRFEAGPVNLHCPNAILVNRAELEAAAAREHTAHARWSCGQAGLTLRRPSPAADS